MGLGTDEKGAMPVTGLQRMSQPPSRAELAVDAIRKAILGGVFPPGQQLVERTLAAQLGVSKTPIREALRSLENSGLLDSHPSRGVIVRRVDAKLVEDLYAYRLLLEPTAVRLAIPHQDPALLRRAQKTLETARDRGGQRDLSGLSQLNRTFHELLYERCPNDLIASGLSGMRDQLTLVAAAGWRTEPTWDLERGEHLAIMEAVTNGDADEAARLTHEHIESAWARLLSTIG